MQLVIPMSGIGTRFKEAGYTTPKPLIKVDGIPMIQHVVNLFPGVDNIKFIANDKHLKETNMREILESLSGEIFEVPYGTKKGPVDVVYSIKEHINDNEEVIVSYCDYGTYWNYEEFLKTARKADGSIACYKGFHPHMLGKDNYAFVKENNKTLIEIREKRPFTTNRMNEYASNGTYYFSNGRILKKYFKKLLESEQTINDEYYVSMVYNFLVKDGLNVNIFEIENMLQWGTPHDMEMYNEWSRYFSNIIKKQPKIKSIPGTTTILPMAGKGSRFQKEGFLTPKPLININGLPMVVQAVNCLPETDSYVFICLEEHYNDIEPVLKGTYKNTTVIPIARVTEGQACTCEIGIEKSEIDLEKPIIISACDNGAYYDHVKFYKMMQDDNIDIIVWSFRNNQTSSINPNAYAWLDVDENEFIKHVSCKKFIYDNPLKTHAIIGTMFFRKAKYFLDGFRLNYEHNIRTNEEFYVDDVLNQNIKAGLKVKVFEVENYICWGTPDDYRTYRYWKDFFNKCNWHPYSIEKDTTWKQQ